MENPATCLQQSFCGEHSQRLKITNLELRYEQNISFFTKEVVLKYYGPSSFHSVWPFEISQQ